MKRFPLWKIRRESKRFKMQFSQWSWFVFGAARKFYYDKFEQHKIQYTDGNQPVLKDIAIILIYQPDGIFDSLRFELEYMISKGIAPIIVSNVPLKEGDRNHLKDLSHLIIERPNYGYDFGGYRDGVKAILKRGYNPENLFILNDSIWFPLNKNCTLIDKARANPADVFGIFCNDVLHRKNKYHLQSYFYRFKGSLVASDQFRRYWQQITLTNNKHMVVRQCEMKLTQWFAKKGSTFDALHDLNGLFAATKKLNDDELLAYMRYLAKVSTRTKHLVSPYHNATQLSVEERAELDDHIEKGRLGKYFLNSHPLVLIREMNSPTLKKDKQFMYIEQRRALFEWGFSDHFDERILAEISSWDQPPA